MSNNKPGTDQSYETDPQRSQAWADKRIAGLEAHIEALQEKQNAESCACSHDELTDVCLGHSPMLKKAQEENASLKARIGVLETDLADLRRWEATVRSNSPLLIRLEQAEKNAMFDVEAFIEHLNTLADNARENGYMDQADAVEDMMDELRQWPARSPWRPIEEADKDGQARLLYSEDLISLDFNPEGIVEGSWMNNPDNDNEECWVGAVWNGCHDTWVTKKIDPTHFMPKPLPPQA